MKFAKQEISPSLSNTLNINATADSVKYIQCPLELEDTLRAGVGKRRDGIILAGCLSNTLLGEKVEGDLIVFRDGNFLDINRKDNLFEIEVAASYSLDNLVERLIEEGISGVELLSGIPGTIGAAIVQNVAAYGTQLSNWFVSATVFNLAKGQIEILHHRDIGFSYRSTNLKQSKNYTPPYILIRVILNIPCDIQPMVTYQDLVKHHESQKRDVLNINELRKTVLEVRSKKGMVVNGPNWMPCAGSYFVSPVIPNEVGKAIAANVRGSDFAELFLSWYKPDAEATRLPAAILMRAAGFMNGDRWGEVGLSPNHILALCNFADGDGSDIVSLQEIIIERVNKKFGALLVPEVRFLGNFRNQTQDQFTSKNHFIAGSSEPEWARALGVPF